MPELPEVETVRRTLIDLAVGKTVAKADVRWPKIVKRPEETVQFQDALAGETIQDISRRGKFLIFHLDHYALVTHLRMEGKFSVKEQSEPEAPHTHVVFTFTDGTELRYRDVRKFGTMHLFEKGTENRHAPLIGLGPEPFDVQFTADYLYDRLKRTSRQVKTALLDQIIVTGLGNIYVDEVLFRSRVHPHRRSTSISKEEAGRIHYFTKSVLAEAIDRGGSTIRSYVNSQGKKGTFQEVLNVYGRAGEACVECGEEIVKTKTGGRGTHICLHCQPLPEEQS
ncbi:DNA-formamidopyrimidine glycosylase [Domibacillus epiphyticus]|uniref:Formamidopyrimidine-DNA glycosylase n=1 Tax=Domibacillus epiphyticus TaxID=1714355 RepID=A0A1V2A9I5_9BACI|nr:DNA-formamidopyrimidine glycosylase [Domibacillus epiphyticus]OMP67474.1 DNA-formamidopyrimidine glycosylase [Domibacillus epiphyticus]